MQGGALLILGVGYRARGERVQEARPGGGRPLREILANPLVWVAISGAAIGYAVMSFIMTATPLSMTEMAGHDLDDAKRVIQLHIMAMYLPSLISGWLTRVVGIPLMMAAGLLAYLGCIVLAACCYWVLAGIFSLSAAPRSCLVATGIRSDSGFRA